MLILQIYNLVALDEFIYSQKSSDTLQRIRVSIFPQIIVSEMKSSGDSRTQRVRLLWFRKLFFSFRSKIFRQIFRKYNHLYKLVVSETFSETLETPTGSLEATKFKKWFYRQLSSLVSWIQWMNRQVYLNLYHHPDCRLTAVNSWFYGRNIVLLKTMDAKYHIRQQYRSGAVQRRRLLLLSSFELDCSYMWKRLGESSVIMIFFQRGWGLWWESSLADYFRRCARRQVRHLIWCGLHSSYS